MLARVSACFVVCHLALVERIVFGAFCDAFSGQPLIMVQPCAALPGRQPYLIVLGDPYWGLHATSQHSRSSRQFSPRRILWLSTQTQHVILAISRIFPSQQRVDKEAGCGVLLARATVQPRLHMQTSLLSANERRATALAKLFTIRKHDHQDRPSRDPSLQAQVHMGSQATHVERVVLSVGPMLRWRDVVWMRTMRFAQGFAPRQALGDSSLPSLRRLPNICVVCVMSSPAMALAVFSVVGKSEIIVGGQSARQGGGGCNSAALTRRG